MWTTSATDGGTQPSIGRFGWWGGGQWQSQVIVTVIDVTDGFHPQVLEKTVLDGRVFVVAQDNLDIPAPALLPVGGTDGNPTPPFTADPVSFTDADGIVTTILPPIELIWPAGGQQYVYEDAAAYRARLEKAWTDHGLPTYTATAASGVSPFTTSASTVSVGRRSRRHRKGCS